MNLDVKFLGLNEVLRRMGATPIHWQADVQNISELEIQLLQKVGGFEIKDIKQIIPDGRGILTYKGETVILYIRDNTQETKYSILKSSDARRFHIYYCTTLETMKKAGRYNRYQITQNTSGMFSVDVRITKRSNRIEQTEARLLVCKNCLVEVKYKECGKSGKATDKIRDSFNIEEWLRENKPTFPTLPRYNDYVRSKSDYSKDWSLISQKKKANAGWRCKTCSVYLGELHHQRFLNTHHIDGDKGNNSPLNLKVLCVECHSKEPLHGQMLRPEKNKRDLDLLRRIKANQGFGK